MSSFNPQDLIVSTFIRLRQSGFQLGVGELLGARQAVEGGFGENEEALAETLKILWCHSPSEQSQFDPIWKSLLVSSTPKQLEKTSQKEPKTEPHQKREEEPQEIPSPPPPQESVSKIESELELALLPIRVPFTPVENDDTSALQTYYPISCRSMIYNWRYLRRPIANGSLDVLDVNATIKLATRQGFYLNSVYRRREQNNAFGKRNGVERAKFFF